MNELEKIGLEKLTDQLHEIKKSMEESIKIMDTRTPNQWNGMISVSHIHVMGRIDRALKTLDALKGNV